MTGRRILRLLPVLAATLLLSVCSKTPTLNLLVWEGYADPSFVQGFRRAVSLQGLSVVHGIE